MVELCQQSLERQTVTLHTMNVITVKTQQLLRTAYIGNVIHSFLYMQMALELIPNF